MPSFNNLTFTVSLISILFLCACSETEAPDSSPTVTTVQVNVLSVGGANFIGEMTNHGMITDHGFIYGIDSSLRMHGAIVISLKQPIASGRYEHHMNGGLMPNQVYYFKAYIEVNGHKTYGETKSFLSNGSEAPIIENVNPDKGFLGQQIQIKGKNFGTSPLYTKVYFGEQMAHNLSINDSIITVTIPINLTKVNFPLKVSVYEKSDQIPYSLQRPEISSIEPSTGTFRSIISIRGVNFDSIASQNHVLIGGRKAIVVSSTRNEIKFVVPDELNMENSSIQLTSQLQQATANTQFKLITPLINEFPDCTKTNDSFEIKGEYFNPIFHLNEVYFGTAKAEIISGDKDRLTVKVPHGPFPGAKAKLNVKIGDITATHPKEICIDDEWVMISNSVPFFYFRDVGSFVLGDNAYVISISNNFSDRARYLWEYNPDAASWTKSSLPFTPDLSGNCTDNGIKGYAYTADYNNNFWEYDPNSKKWTKKADFPGQKRDFATMFSIGKYVYLGIGHIRNISNITVYHDFYKYDPDLDKWTRIADLVPNLHRSRVKAGVFVINGIAYLSGGANNSGDIEAWKYDPETNIWSRIADLPYPIDYDVQFMLNGKGYVIGNYRDSYIYDPHINIWTKSYSIGNSPRSGAFSFVLNGKAYVGGGDTDYYNKNSYQLFNLMK